MYLNKKNELLLKSRYLLNSTIFHDAKSYPITALIDMMLREEKGAILGNEVTNHACKDPTIIS